MMIAQLDADTVHGNGRILTDMPVEHTRRRRMITVAIVMVMAIGDDAISGRAIDARIQIGAAAGIGAAAAQVATGRAQIQTGLRRILARLHHMMYAISCN